MINVLIIEDDPMVAKFTAIYVSKVQGFKVVGTANGTTSGLDILQHTQVDLILLDIYMNQENGLDLLIELRKKKLPVDVIVISSANDNQSIQTALRYGAIDYLMKPFDFVRFQEALLRYQQHRKQLQTEGIQQKDLDTLFIGEHRGVEQAEDVLRQPLPKGITRETYIRILNEISELDGWFSTALLADQTGISRVSLRKYLRYLEEKKILISEVSYGGNGRPLQRYKLSSMGHDYVLDIIE